MNSTIVIGGRMAGMLAARALSETFDRVTILERDLISGNLEGRPGVPQARHLHALLSRGRRRILERWFKGITSEFQAAGAQILDVANEIAWLTPQGWGVRFPSKFEALTLTRDLLDWVVRRRLLQLPNVKLLHGCEVKSLRSRVYLVEGVNLTFRSENGRGASTDFLGVRICCRGNRQKFATHTSLWSRRSRAATSTPLVRVLPGPSTACAAIPTTNSQHPPTNSE